MVDTCHQNLRLYMRKQGGDGAALSASMANSFETKKELVCSINQAYDGEVTEDLLVGTPGSLRRIDLEAQKTISSAVHKFVLATKKEL